MRRILVLLFSSMALSGCYYMQAASGQWEVMRKREPLADVIADPHTSPELAARLRLLNEARDFSIEALGLPDNKSYRSYTELERDYVVWNVLAVPEFSLTPKQWCFPVAGCVNYRGYFSEDDAIRESARLADDGFDVAVGGVAAYSTLGNFSDPILSTMMRWDDVRLVALLFHELAHQLVYVKDDSSFNESFASAVEEFGVQRWLEARQQGAAFDQYLRERDYRGRLLQVVDAARSDLNAIYSSARDEQQKREQKRRRLQLLTEDVAAEAAASGRKPSAWLSGPVNNAHLVSMNLYRGRLAAFRAIYAGCAESIDCFYEAARALAAMPRAERDTVLSSGDLRRFGRGTNDR